MPQKTEAKAGGKASSPPRQNGQEDHTGHAYATNALTQYDIPTGEGYSEESDLAVEDAKRRVDENKK